MHRFFFTSKDGVPKIYFGRINAHFTEKTKILLICARIRSPF